jgi:PAS domain S-box-containing protein
VRDIGRARKAAESAAQTLTLRGLRAKRKSERVALAFPGMDVDVMNNLLSHVANATDLGEYLTEEIRKLTSARCVSLTQCLSMPTEIAHRLVSINPVRQRGWAESAEARRLYDAVHYLPSMQVWRAGDNSEVTRLLKQQGYDLSVAVPLRVGAFHVGAILVLGLPNEINLDSKVKLLDTLSTITALVLYGAFLYEKQEEIVRERTAGLQKANERLQVELSERRRAEKELDERNRFLAGMNALGAEMAASRLGATPDPKEILAKRLLEMTEAAAAWFCDYDPSDRTLVPRSLEVEPGMLNGIIHLLGKLPSEVRSPVSKEMYSEIVTNTIGRRQTLTEASFGEIPPSVGAAIQEALGVDRFIGIAYVVEGELYGTSVLAMKSGMPDPPTDLLESVSLMVAVSLSQRRTEEALRESERQIKLLLDKTQESRNALLSILEDEKKAEKARKVSEQRFTTAFHASPAMMTIVSLKDQKYIEVNRAFEEITGYRPDEVIGRTLLEMAIWYEAEEATRAIQDIASTGGHRNLEARFRTKTGESRVALLSTGVVELDGEACVLTTGEDITERKEAETRRRKALEEIALAGRLASVGRLASGIAHEINNPLSAVIGYAQLLMEKDVPKDIKEDLEAIDDNAQRVAKIVKGLLTFARGSKPGRDYVDMNTLVSKTLGLRAHEMSIHNIEVITRLAPYLPQILADQSQMQQVFLNIILNAEQSMTKAHNGGHLEVRTTRVGDHIRVAFKDDGLGIAKENMSKLFEPFFTTKEVGEGTGLGLSISYGIVQQHGGRIYARGRSGPGAIFVVELPIVAKPDQPESSEEEAREPERKVNGKVLVVDDEPAICQLLAGVLTREGHSVDTVGDAEAALEKMQRERFSVVLLDIRMKGMDGFRLYEEMGKIAQSLQKRVIFITGDTLAPDTREFLAKTESPYLGKPFDLRQLRKMVNETLASG